MGRLRLKSTSIASKKRNLTTIQRLSDNRWTICEYLPSQWATLVPGPGQGFGGEWLGQTRCYYAFQISSFLIKPATIQYLLSRRSIFSLKSFPYSPPPFNTGREDGGLHTPDHLRNMHRNSRLSSFWNTRLSLSNDLEFDVIHNHVSYKRWRILVWTYHSSHDT